ncbi:hypothetical protein [Rheinheimera salexigens]|uniref:KfrA N-terminal DNA-binding domain-containing protein n=1 Tax=Rheinheimera salexigens TaxID=1628148 RepID=A0A1E7Q8Z4_9GAMM|nr:hypothetical protein [Rheinheimera salexigens]OEY70600.1 hypothetical protein BI198_14255 [Rheinheimera salexigens]
MTDSVTLLQQVAAQLQQEGKTPSLALFRARLAGQISAPQLFSAYQHWRANPIFASGSALNKKQNTAPTEQASSELADNDIVTSIATRLARIEAKLDQILTKLEQP